MKILIWKTFFSSIEINDKNHKLHWNGIILYRESPIWMIELAFAQIATCNFKGESCNI